MPQRWFVRAGDADQEKGPLSYVELQNLLRDGQLPHSCLVRRDDMAEPRRADAVEGLIVSASTPAIPPIPRSGRSPRSWQFVNPNPLGMAAIVCLVLCGVADGVAVFADLNQAALLEDLAAGMSKTEAELNASDNFFGAAGLAQSATYVLSAIVFLFWIYRVSANQRALGAKRVLYSPGWAVGGWFVPFLNLVRPFQVVREIWINSSPASNPGNQVTTGLMRHYTPPLIGVWWALWLGSNVLSTFAGRMLLRADDLASMQRATSTMLASDAIDIAAVIFAVLLVYRTTSWQVLAEPES